MGVFERRPSREEQAIQDMRVFFVEYLNEALGSIYTKVESIEKKLEDMEKKLEEMKKDGVSTRQRD